MTVKVKSQYVCQGCGAVSPKWVGQCPGCGDWNTLVEELVDKRAASPGAAASAARRGSSVSFVGLSAPSEPVPRTQTGIGELDRVLGGGVVPGSVVLIGGDPGIGKSTLLLQMAAALANRGTGVAYISGEESIDQVRMRARRLGVSDSDVQLAASSDAFAIGQALVHAKKPVVAIIDSIQTMQMAGLDSAPGTVSQVRASAHELIRIAKEHDIPLFIVGHVTKEGTLAGPKVLEHAVDTVLYAEGDRGHQYRILRAVKNRFGATDEIGVFAMGEAGMAEVPNPSAIFLSDRDSGVAGSVVFPGMEGTRPILVEVQALVVPTAASNARRAVVGWDNSRLAMVLAVLEARCGVSLSMCDVYLNVVGGYRINEPAADLAVAAALMSAHTGAAMPADAVVFGEIGLGGEIRPVGQTDARLKEATKLGFPRAFAPEPQQVPGQRAAAGNARPIVIRRLLDLMSHIEDIKAAG